VNYFIDKYPTSYANNNDDGDDDDVADAECDDGGDSDE
jgi:hypothetical protein